MMRRVHDSSSPFACEGRARPEQRAHRYAQQAQQTEPAYSNQLLHLTITTYVLGYGVVAGTGLRGEAGQVA